jgi:hypothetical protein
MARRLHVDHAQPGKTGTGKQSESRGVQRDKHMSQGQLGKLPRVLMCRKVGQVGLGGRSIERLLCLLWSW